MKAPQIIMTLLIILSLIQTLLHHGESKGNYDFGTAIVAAILEIALLNWGGFY